MKAPKLYTRTPERIPQEMRRKSCSQSSINKRTILRVIKVIPSPKRKPNSPPRKEMCIQRSSIERLMGYHLTASWHVWWWRISLAQLCRGLSRCIWRPSVSDMLICLPVVICRMPSIRRLFLCSHGVCQARRRRRGTKGRRRDGEPRVAIYAMLSSWLQAT
jgi:hypothetical protein